MSNVETRLQQALAFAAARHGDQKYGNQPYTVHLEAVIQVARDFDLGPDVLVATALHDPA